MAEGDLNKTITADGSQALREYHKLANANEKLKEQVRASNAAGNKGVSDVTGALKGQLSAITGISAGLFTVEGAVGLVVDQYSAWDKKMVDIAQRAEGIAATTTKTLQNAGLLMQGPQAMAAIDSIGGTREQKLALFGGVAEGGAGLGVNRQAELAREAAKFTMFESGKVGDLQGTGKFIGRLGDILPEKSADDIADLAAGMQQTSKGGIGQFADAGFMQGIHKLIGSGAMTAEQALGLAAKATTKDISAKTIAELGDVLSKDYEMAKPERGKKLTAEQLAQNRFAQASATDRLDLLFADKSVREKILGQGKAEQFGRLTKADLDAAGDSLVSAQRDNVLDKMVGGLDDTAMGMMAKSAQEKALREDQRSAAKELGAVEKADYDQAFQEAKEDHNITGIAAMAQDASYKLIQFLTQMAGAGAADVGHSALKYRGQMEGDNAFGQQMLEMGKEILAKHERVAKLAEAAAQGRNGQAAAATRAQGRE